VDSPLPAVRAKRQSEQLQDQYNAEYPAYAKDCIDPVTAGSSALLTGEKMIRSK